VIYNKIKSIQPFRFFRPLGLPVNSESCPVNGERAGTDSTVVQPPHDFGMHKKTHRKIFIAGFLFAGLLVFIFFLAGEKFLRIESDSQNQRTDAVVVLAGSAKEDKGRIEEGSALIREGKGRYLILPLRHSAIDWPWAVQYYGLHEALPEDKVLIGRSTKIDESLIDQFGGTYVEAIKTVRIMRDLDLTSAIIVSSAYHMRRAKIAFEQFRQPGRFEFYYHPVDPESKRKKPWWTDTEYVARVLQEYKKLLAAYFIYNLNPPTVP
jgi:uncharacterized SAM-binding protein YcdF (DUF218 family)